MKRLTKTELKAPKVAAAFEAGLKATADTSSVIVMAETISRLLTSAKTIDQVLAQTYGVKVKDVLDADQLAVLEKAVKMQADLMEVMNTCVAFVDGKMESHKRK